MITRIIAAIIAAVLWAWLTAPASAQEFEELRNRLPVDYENTYAVALGDVDVDGDLDLVFGNSGQNRLYLNNGTGVFSDATAARMPVDSDDTYAVALGDVDVDGDLDIVFGNGMQNRLYLNDGTGTFADATASRLPAYAAHTEAVALADVDGDGDLDIVCGNIFLPDTLYVNDGTGTFTLASGALPANMDFTYALAVDDVDGDGDLDTVFGIYDISLAGKRNRLYLNDGTGIFTDGTAARMPFDYESTVAAAMGDVDGDDDLDLVFGNDKSHSGQNVLYLNEGNGTFTDVTARQMPIYLDGTQAVALDDVDGDGDLDLVFGNSGQNRLYLNDGTGTFTDVTAARMPVDSDSTCAVALGDVDADGDLDLVFGNSGQNRLYLNLLRQLDAPFLARAGSAYQLDIYARYGTTRQQDVAQLWLSTGRASIPVLPIGTFGLDPTQMVALPRVIVPQPGGMASLSFTIPNAPSLIGVAFYAQALLVHDPVTLPAVLSNVTVDVVQ